MEANNIFKLVLNFCSHVLHY